MFTISMTDALSARAERWENQQLEIPPFVDNPGVIPVDVVPDSKQKPAALRLNQGCGIASGERHRQHGLIWKMYASLAPQNPIFTRKLAEDVELEIFKKSKSHTDYRDFSIKRMTAIKAQEDVLKILGK